MKNNIVIFSLIAIFAIMVWTIIVQKQESKSKDIFIEAYQKEFKAKIFDLRNENEADSLLQAKRLDAALNKIKGLEWERYINLNNLSNELDKLNKIESDSTFDYFNDSIKLYIGSM